MRTHPVLTIGKRVASAAAAYAYVVPQGTYEDQVDLPSASGVAGEGILLPPQNATSYSANDQADVCVIGLVPFNKTTGHTIAYNDLLVVGDTSGNLITIGAGDTTSKVVAISKSICGSTDVRGTCLLVGLNLLQ